MVKTDVGGEGENQHIYIYIYKFSNEKWKYYRYGISFIHYKMDLNCSIKCNNSAVWNHNAMLKIMMQHTVQYIVRTEQYKCTILN